MTVGEFVKHLQEEYNQDLIIGCHDTVGRRVPPFTHLAEQWGDRPPEVIIFPDMTVST